ncbi:MAG: baseplate J/gp47 family protein [Treponema sp.]|jgi:uncharacterized phage protein gp47/JayE|nr:baseplate J/gp47 family protein [Treponema sp.]
MPFKRDSLNTILERTYANYVSLYKPLDRMPRHSLLKVFSAIDAGIYHQLLGDLDFLALQLFPDTATGTSLREHWSTRVPPLHATAAFGKVLITGTPNRAVPAGLVFASAMSERYFTEKQYRLNSDGFAIVDVRSENFGTNINLPAGAKLKIVSAIPAGIDSDAEVADDGISGGVDGESDEEYLTRVLAALRGQFRYGKENDFTGWALDSSPEISAAWEYKNFGVFGALLIQVINGNQFDGVRQVNNLNVVKEYINRYAPPVCFTVRTPEIIPVNPAVALLPAEDNQINRQTVVTRMLNYLQVLARPGFQVSAENLKTAVVDGIQLTDGIVKINGSTNGVIPATVLQYPVLGEVSWE